MTNQLPIDFKDSRGRKVFEDLIANLPEEIEVYLIAGSLRNAIDRYFHKASKLEQRDYDLVVTNGNEAFIGHLRTLGFFNGRIQRPVQKVMVKSFVGNDDPDDFAKNVVLDIHLADGTNILDNLKKHVGLTVNGNAILLRDVFAEKWQEKLVSLPGALKAIEEKRLEINLEGYKDQPANIFSVIRFVHNGYTPPSKEELDLLIRELPRIEEDRYDKNVKKVYTYVGGEANARKICQEIGINDDIFDSLVTEELIS